MTNFIFLFIGKSSIRQMSLIFNSGGTLRGVIGKTND